MNTNLSTTIFTVNREEMHALRDKASTIIMATKELADCVDVETEEAKTWLDMIKKNADEALKLLNSIGQGPS